ncbi:hypothetical protein [Macrococcus sp. DPC7161]|uniref:hypothetical protein n=1 Tax=Macrococcus sp. DPC7161 TaxID=2507060 RepID=UPI00100A6695|nr:hypothetical protein [Macrococcus sp. DPC7161]RXK18333.1 hypothetical protein ER639_06480 [Macrococcus sp. DPC7161]
MKILNGIFFALTILFFGLLVSTYFGNHYFDGNNRIIIYIGFFGSLIISNILDRKIKKAKLDSK